MSTEPRATVSVDRSVCQGTGYCEHLLPQVFRVGADGHASVQRHLETDAEIELAREAEDICPTRAILLELEYRG